MSHDLRLLLIALTLMGFSLVAKAVSRSVLTAPMLALTFGFLLAYLDMVPPGFTEEHLRLLAEVALVILLFLDAARTDVQGLIRKHVWPVRTLLLGMPLAFLGGSLTFWLLLPEWPFPVIMLLAALLVPTDAALGQSVVESEAVPARQKRAIVVESGLNDGIALPAILMFAAFAAPNAEAPAMGWPLFGALQVIVGFLVGGVLGPLAGSGLIFAQSRGTTSELYEGIAALALAATAFFAATILGGNGFVAAFVCGVGFGWVVGGRCQFVFEFTEGEGQLLSWAAFFLIGALLMPQAIAALDVRMLAAIMLSLICVRPLAIMISLLWTDADFKTRLFIGWLGPRGLATALFALLVAERLAPDVAEYVLHFAVNAVWISALLHGLTAIPFINAIGRH